MATLNPFASTEIVEEVIKSNAEKTVEIEVVNTPITNIIEELLVIKIPEAEVFSVITPEKTHFLIVGAFADQKNANNMLNTLYNSNNSPEILEGEGLIKVSYDSFYNKEDAEFALKEIKQEIPEAWLLTK
jgi:cell division protein FtsN